MASTQQLLPVDPALDRDDAGPYLRTLVPLLGRAGATPVLPPPLDGFWDFEFEARSLSTSASMALGVSAAFKGSTAINSSTLIWNALVGKRAVLANPTADSVVYETFWGVGLRVAITFVATEINTSTDVAMVAAAAEFWGSDVQYEIHSIGLGPRELATVLRALPPLGRFDLGTYSILDEVRASLKTSLLAGLPATGDASKVLRPVQVSVSASPFHESVDDAAVHHLVMKCVAAGLDLAGTRQYGRNAGWTGLNEARLASVFRKVTGGETKPRSDVVKQAVSWLNLG